MCSTFKQKKKAQKKFELKSGKKKKIVTKPSPQRAQYITEVARSRQAHEFSTKKKKSIQRIRNETHHVASREIKPIMSLVEKSNPNTVYTAQKQNKLQQTKHRGVYQKKKKIPHTQTKTKPQQTKPSNPRSRRRSSLVVVVVVARPSSQIADRFASTPVLGAPSDPPSRYFSLFLSDSLSVSLSLSH